MKRFINVRLLSFLGSRSPISKVKLRNNFFFFIELTKHVSLSFFFRFRDRKTRASSNHRRLSFSFFVSNFEFLFNNRSLLSSLGFGKSPTGELVALFFFVYRF